MKEFFMYASFFLVIVILFWSLLSERVMEPETTPPMPPEDIAATENATTQEGSVDVVEDAPLALILSDAPPGNLLDDEGKLYKRVMERTKVTAVLETVIPENTNVIWTASFNAAWEKTKILSGEPVRIQGAGMICELLNGTPSPEDYVPDDALYSAAGFVDTGILEKIHSDMALKFPEHDLPDFKIRRPDDFLAYALLKADITFPIPYTEFPEAFGFSEGSGIQQPVKSFGVAAKGNHKLKQQLGVLYKGNSGRQDQYIIDLCNTGGELQLILAMVPRLDTLAETLAQVDALLLERYNAENYMEIQSTNVYGLGRKDIFWAPNIDLHVMQHFTTLEDRSFLNTMLEGYSIYKAQEEIEFTLDRTGAHLIAESIIGGTRGREPDPYWYVFDRPFLLIMKTRGADMPFMLMWVDNAEVMQLY